MQIDQITLLLSLLLVDFIAVASPGPNFFIVSSSAVQASRTRTLFVVLGIVASNLVWCAAVGFGLSLLFTASPKLYTLAKVFGGAYLVYLSIVLWRSGPNNFSPATQQPSGGANSAISGFLRGLFVGLSNPKSLIYFSSVFTVFMAPGSPACIQACAVVIVVFNSVAWYGAVALLLSKPGFQRAYMKQQQTLNRIAGTLIGAFGIRLVLARE